MFELPESELETLSHLKLRIVKEERFSDDDFVGETMQVSLSRMLFFYDVSPS